MFDQQNASKYTTGTNNTAAATFKYSATAAAAAYTPKRDDAYSCNVRRRRVCVCVQRRDIFFFSLLRVCVIFTGKERKKERKIKTADKTHNTIIYWTYASTSNSNNTFCRSLRAGVMNGVNIVFFCFCFRCTGTRNRS